MAGSTNVATLGPKKSAVLRAISSTKRRAFLSGASW